MLTASDAHSADVNVISWNKKEPRFLVSGGDDGAVKIWDLRQFGGNSNAAIATFKQHTAPVTTVEWHPEEATVFASGGADDQIAQWDLSVEIDQEEEPGDKELADLPPQLLFIHQGQSDVKELHWHPQIPGVLISTAHSGFNVFRTISV
uniref:Grwd1_1 protein n=1 Tax=Fopius arisanus TaxID=64838 RepID=A0A0C9Q612_9HYME